MRLTTIDRGRTEHVPPVIQCKIGGDGGSVRDRIFPDAEWWFFGSKLPWRVYCETLFVQRGRLCLGESIFLLISQKSCLAKTFFQHIDEHETRHIPVEESQFGDFLHCFYLSL